MGTFLGVASFVAGKARTGLRQDNDQTGKCPNRPGGSHSLGWDNAAAQKHPVPALTAEIELVDTRFCPAEIKFQPQNGVAVCRSRKCHLVTSSATERVQRERHSSETCVRVRLGPSNRNRKFWSAGQESRECNRQADTSVGSFLSGVEIRSLDAQAHAAHNNGADRRLAECSRCAPVRAVVPDATRVRLWRGISDNGCDGSSP
jgi:hypothetical protein